MTFDPSHRRPRPLADPPAMGWSRTDHHDSCPAEDVVTLVWFIIWLIANNVGTHEPLLFNPVNAWTATLILAIALDLGASHARAGNRTRS